MKLSPKLRPLSAILTVGILACGGQEACAAGGETGDAGDDSESYGIADVAGYYTFGPEGEGAYHLALLDDNRFMLIREPTGEGVSPGYLGWYGIEGEDVLLSSDLIRGRAQITTDGLDLTFVEAPWLTEANPQQEPYGLRRIIEGASPQSESGSGGGQGGNQSGGGQGQSR